MTEISRREFIRVSALATAGIAAAACAKTPTEAPTEAAPPAATPKPAEPTATPKPAEPTPVPEPAVADNQAPMLAKMVEGGNLPSLEERLPESPCVCPVLETTGSYGGTMRRGFKGVSDRWGPTKVIRECLAWYNDDLSLRTNIAEAWDINEDASQWTFNLRKGMKWSDGEPFTTASFKWWYDNELLNETLTSSPGRVWTTGPEKTVMELEYPDDFTVVFKFADPNPLFIYNIAMNSPWQPGHYLAQFHMDLTDDKAGLEKATTDAGFASWDEYYWDRQWWYMNPETPQVGPWVSNNPLSEELFVMGRNPYFFQVEEDGNQLPYIDQVNHRLFETPDVFNLWILNGEIDYQGRHVALANWTLFKENEDKGDFTVHYAASDMTLTYWINHTSDDPLKREFFQDRDVRIALSHAINREEINELVYDGLYSPRQYSPPSNSPQYYEKLTNAYIEYDPDLANELLDKAGYTERDAEGFRLWKDGSGKAGFVIESNSTPGSPDEDEMLMVAKYWEDVGLDVTLTLLERSIVEEHKRANQIDCRYSGGSRAVLPLVDPSFFVAFALDKSYCQRWSQWRSDPSHTVAEEPPQDHWIRDMWGLWDQVTMEPDADKQSELFRQILDIWVEELPAPGTVGEGPAPLIVKNGLRNLPFDYHMPYSNPTKHGCFVPMQTYFWDDPEAHS